MFLRTAILLLAAAAFTTTCDRTAPPTSVPVLPIQASIGSPPQCATGGNTLPYISPVFSCGALVSIEVTNGASFVGSVGEARNEWSKLLNGDYNLPTLGIPSTAAQATPKITVTFEYHTGNKWCGSTSISTHVITVARTSETCPLPDPSGQTRVVDDLIGVLKHEFSHALGFPRHLNDGGYHPLTARCLANVPNDPFPFNSTLCSHDRALVQWGYGLRSTEPSLDSDLLASSISLTPGSASIAPGGTQQITAQAIRDDGQPANVEWFIEDERVATFTVPPTNPGATVRGETYGQTAIIARVVETPQLGWPTGQTSATLTVVDLPPSGLSASNVGSTTATINWTNGNAASTTTIQTRPAGTQNWNTAGVAQAGDTSLPISNLTPCTSYDGQAYHVTVPITIANLFRTTGGSIACAPLNFTLVSCTDETINGNVYRTYNVAWTRGEFSTGSTYDIGQTNTSNPAGATIVKSGPSYKTNAAIGPYLRSQSQLLYFWVRHKLSGGTGPSAWVPLDNQPVNPNGGCF